MHLKLVGLWLRLRMWFGIILLRFLYVCGPINVITKTTYNSQSCNSPNSIILVYSAGLQFCLVFFFLHFSLLTIPLSQPLTSFYFLWVLCSYSLQFFCNLCSLLWLFCNLLWFFHNLIFFCHFISIFCLYNTLDCSQS